MAVPSSTGRISTGSAGRPASICPTRTPGTLPDAKWRADRNRIEAECDSATGPFAYTDGTNTSSTDHPGWHRSPKRSPGGCGIADGTNRPWSIGDNESLAVGQGDVQVTPLQLAVAYSAIANGGTSSRRTWAWTRSLPRGSCCAPSTRRAPPEHRPVLSRHDPGRPAGGGLAVGRDLGRRVPELPRAGLRQDRHRAVHRPAGLRLVRLLVPSSATTKPIVVV